MPSPPHPCAYPGCTTLVQRKTAIHCKKHVPRTAEWNARNAAGNRGKRLSEETRRKLSEARSGRETHPCAHCGTLFSVKPCERAAGRGRFCSRQCGYAARRGAAAPNWKPDMPTVPCRVCGKEFRLPAATRAGERFACSYTCKNVWQKTHQRTQATDIERAMAAAFERQGWHYEFQVGLCNVCTADFYLPEFRTVVFCDGDYWHSLPRQLERDPRQTAILQEAGYRVCRFKGSAILADVDACIRIIAAGLQS